MTHGFDRFERLFAYKRKPAPLAVEMEDHAARHSETYFPSPSFIHPKTTRMAAREEVSFVQAAGRSPSMPTIHSARDLPSKVGNPSSVSPLGQAHQTLVHFSYRSRRLADNHGKAQSEHRLLPPMNVHDDSTAIAHISVKKTELTARSRPQNPQPRFSSKGAVQSPKLSNASVPISNCPSFRPALSKTKASGPARDPRGVQSISKMSFQLPATTGLKAQVSASVGVPNDGLMDKLKGDRRESIDQLSLQGSFSQSSLSRSAQASFCSSTLREPDFNEFLGLSDDDIAESRPSSPASSRIFGNTEPSLPSMELSISSMQPRTTPLLTLTPPRASRPAAVAAFEAARIARRYNFDLIYAVNLWPVSATWQQLSPGQCRIHDEANMASMPMMGRLLAAHGLHHVPSPLQISAMVHRKILRSDGWIEYRNENARCRDLARGYACAFYTGNYARKSSADGPISGNIRLSQRIERGIVFAAYRKPAPGGDKLGHTLNEMELGNLYREAEALVEMLIDIHVASRLRHPPAVHSLSDETGPMPILELRH